MNHPSPKESQDILGHPSGEVLTVKTIFAFNKLILSKLISYSDIFRMWYYKDENRQSVIYIIDED
jgi:hypothetical protein